MFIIVKLTNYKLTLKKSDKIIKQHLFKAYMISTELSLLKFLLEITQYTLKNFFSFKFYQTGIVLGITSF